MVARRRGWLRGTTTSMSVTESSLLIESSRSMLGADVLVRTFSACPPERYENQGEANFALRAQGRWGRPRFQRLALRTPLENFKARLSVNPILDQIRD